MLSNDAARALTDKIINDLATLNGTLTDDIVKAFTEEAHTALGMSWKEYASQFPKLRLSPAERRAKKDKIVAAVQASRGEEAPGMSETEVAQALGYSPSALNYGKDPPRKGYTETTVDAYRQVVADHPIWGKNQIASMLDVGQSELRGLKMLAEAPAEFREKYFAGEVTFAAVEAILGHNVAEHLADDAKVTVLRKAIAGLTGGASAGRLWTVMNLIPQIHGALKARWMDESLGMSYDDLLAAALESTARMNKGMADEKEWLALNGPTYSYSLHTPNLLEKLRATLGQIEKEMPALVRLTFETDELGGELRELGRRLYAIGEQVINKGVAPEARPAPDDTPVRVFEGLQDSDYVDGYAVIDG